MRAWHNLTGRATKDPATRRPALFRKWRLPASIPTMAAMPEGACSKSGPPGTQKPIRQSGGGIWPPTTRLQRHSVTSSNAWSATSHLVGLRAGRRHRGRWKQKGGRGSGHDALSVSVSGHPGLLGRRRPGSRVAFLVVTRTGVAENGRPPTSTRPYLASWKQWARLAETFVKRRVPRVLFGMTAGLGTLPYD